MNLPYRFNITPFLPSLLIIIVLLICTKANVLPDIEVERGKPHILFILADDLGFFDVPWHNSVVKAPELLNLAKTGVILEQNYVHSMCTPSRSSILSGRYDFELGRQEQLDTLHPTGLSLSVHITPEYLKALGYTTHAIGKWHIGFCNWAYTPLSRGFDSFRGYYTGAEDYYTHINPNVSGTMFMGYDYRKDYDVDFESQGSYSTFQFASRVEEILDETPPSQPKYIYLAFQNVHYPLSAPEEYERQYMFIEDRERRMLLGTVTAMDEAIGRIVTKLKETGHYDNTVIMFVSDNGGTPYHGSVNWPLRGGKKSVWEGGTRAVAFVHSPLLFKKGRVSHALMHASDWSPTIISLAGGTIPEGITGFDQWKIISGETEEPVRRELLYTLVYQNSISPLCAAIREERYKLVIGEPGPLMEWYYPPEGNGSISHYVAGMQGSFVGTSEIISTNWEQPPQPAAVDGLAQGEIPQSPLAPYPDLDLPDVTFSLYDLQADPEEKHDLAAQLPYVVAYLAGRIDSYKYRYVPPDKPQPNFAGNPDNFGGVWSPGFC